MFGGEAQCCQRPQPNTKRCNVLRYLISTIINVILLGKKKIGRPKQQKPWLSLLDLFVIFVRPYANRVSVNGLIACHELDWRRLQSTRSPRRRP